MERIQTIRNLNSAEAYLLTSEVDVSYATGFSGDSSEVLITGKRAYFFTDSRYTLQAERDLGGAAEIVTTGGADRNSAIAKALQAERVGRLGVEMDRLTVNRFAAFQEAFGGVDYVDVSEDILLCRAVKSEEEIAKIAHAAHANEKVLEALVSVIRAGMSEFDVRAELVYQINRQGMDNAFAPVVAAGPNSALPHATTTDYVIREGDLLTLDFGCRYEGYCSDITRTFGIGNVDGELKKIYDIVKTAQERALAAAHTGVAAREIDAAARRYIEENGYGRYFGHGTGHGVGLEIHELPVVNPASRAVLEKNMVYTVEPGIYIPGTGGVRIEDTCVAGRGNLYRFSKEFILI